MSSEPQSAALRLLFLGPPCIERDGRPVETDTRKAVALAAYLAVTGQAHSRDALAALLWPDYEPERAYANLRRTLWSLNRALDKEWLAAEAESVALRRGPGFWLDVDAFRSHLAACAGHGHAESEICPACLPALTAAVELVRGEFLAGFGLRDSAAFDDWQFFQAEELRAGLASALERLVRLHAGQQEPETALAHARRWLALDPLHEPAHRALMALYAQTGQRAAALRQFEQARHLLEAELGAEPEPATVALAAAIREGQWTPQPASLPPSGAATFAVAAAPPVALPPGRAPAAYLPPQPTPFVGRQDELAAVAALLGRPDCRLLSLVGPGGVGKTRLALEAADGQAAAYAHGVYFVPLAPLHAPELLVQAVADAIDFSFFRQEDRQPRDQLLAYLREKQMLLLMDNMEHLLAGAELLPAILAAAPGVRIVVTSRQRLGLRGEWVLDVPGLSVPVDGDLAGLEEFSAVQLFLQSAVRADAGFSLSPADLPGVVRICRLVEGMPLGLELAAAWVKMLSPAEIAAEIARGLDLLTATGREQPDRHRSLRAVFDSSWQLLAPAERQAFSRLTVFAGGFDREAARRVAGADLFLLAALADKSLLRRQAEGRYGIHELLRQSGAEHLAGDPQAEAETRDRHARCFLAFAAEREARLQAGDQRAAADELATELENVRAAWRWALAHGWVAEIRSGSVSLALFLDMRSRFQEGDEAFARAVVALETLQGVDQEQVDREQVDKALGLALTYQAWFAWRLYRVDEGIERARRALAILRPLGPGTELAQANNMAFMGWALGDPAEASVALAESLAIYTRSGDRWGQAMTLMLLGEAAGFWYDLEESQRRHRESLELRTQIGDRLGMAQSLFSLGDLAQMQGDRDTALACYSQSLELRRELGDGWGVALSLDYIGYVLRELGDFERARRFHEESLAASREIGDVLGIAGSLNNLGLVALDQEQYDEARSFLYQGLALREEVGRSGDLAVSRVHVADLALHQGDLSLALDLARQSLDAFQANIWPWGMITARRVLAATLTELGDQAQARTVYCQAMSIAHVTNELCQVVELCGWLAHLHHRQGLGHEAARLAAAVTIHRGAQWRSRQRAEALLARLAAELGAQAVAAARDWAAGRSLDQIINDTLGCLEDSR